MRRPRCKCHSWPMLRNDRGRGPKGWYCCWKQGYIPVAPLREALVDLALPELAWRLAQYRGKNVEHQRRVVSRVWESEFVTFSLADEILCALHLVSLWYENADLRAIYFGLFPSIDEPSEVDASFPNVGVLVRLESVPVTA